VRSKPNVAGLCAGPIGQLAAYHDGHHTETAFIISRSTEKHMKIITERRLAILLSISFLMVVTLACGKVALPTPNSTPVVKATMPAGADTKAPQAEPTAMKQETNAPDTLVVRSYPPGYKVYVVPARDLSGFSMDVIKLTRKEYLVGQTPLDVTLEPGDYTVTVGDPDHPADFRTNSGEDSIIKVFNAKGEATSIGQTYKLIKKAGDRVLLTALFWRKDQTLTDFVNGLTGPDEFPAELEAFEPILRGKAVWYGAEQNKSSMYMYYQRIAPDYQLVIWPAK
jgi:hypothetical protein